jgi:sugar (pentulose or hexulose) kinase
MSTESLVVGLDMGTTSISAVAVDENGHVVRSVTMAHHAAVDGLPEYYAEQCPDRILATALKALRELADRSPVASIAGLGLTGQMHSTVMLDRERRTVGNVVTWQDRRSLLPSSDGTLLSELQKRASDDAMLRTGCRLSSGYMGTTLFALKRLSQLEPQITSVAFVADWIGSCLAGSVPVTERSHAASSGLYDLVSDQWSAPLIEAAEVPREWLPDVEDSGAVIGRVCEAIAESTGLRAGLPVYNAIGDNQASVLSALPDVDGAVLINIGTGGQIVWRVPEFIRELPLDTRVLPGNPDAQGGRSKPQFMIVGAGLCGGDAIAWVNRTVRTWLSHFGAIVSEADVWQKLSIPEAPAGTDRLDSDGLRCEPFFRGTRYEPGRRGKLSGIGLENLTPPNLLRSVLEGIAQSMFDVWRASPTAARSPVRQVTMSGNAVKQNPQLAESVRTCFQVPVEIARHSEEAATGAAMLAGVHLGFWNSLEHARRCVRDAAKSGN